MEWAYIPCGKAAICPGKRGEAEKARRQEGKMNGRCAVAHSRSFVRSRIMDDSPMRFRAFKNVKVDWSSLAFTRHTIPK